MYTQTVKHSGKRNKRVSFADEVDINEWNENSDIIYDSSLGNVFSENNRFWILREKKSKSEALDEIEKDINRISKSISDFKLEYNKILKMSDQNEKMKDEKKGDGAKDKKGRKNLSQINKQYHYCWQFGGNCKQKFLLPNSQKKLDEHLSECCQGPPPAPPSTPASVSARQDDMDPSLHLNLEMTVDGAESLPSTQPSQQSQSSQSQNTTADESIFIHGVTVASTQDPVGHEISKPVKRQRTSPQKGVDQKTRRVMTRDEANLHSELETLEQEMRDIMGSDEEKEYEDDEEEDANETSDDVNLTDDLTLTNTTTSDEVGVKMEKTVKFLEDNKDKSESTGGSSVQEVARVINNVVTHVTNEFVNNVTNDSVNLLNISGAVGGTNIQETNEILREKQEELDKARNAAADHINRNNLLKTENSQLKIKLEDIIEENENLKQKNAELSNQLEATDVRNMKMVQDKLKAVNYDNMRLNGGVNDRDDVIHGLRQATRDLEDKLNESLRKEKVLEDLVKDKQEEGAKMYAYTEKQKAVINKKEEIMKKMHDEAVSRDQRLQEGRMREEDLRKRVEELEKELEDVKNQMETYRKSTEVTVQSHSQVVQSNEILMAESEARKKKEMYCLELTCFDSSKCGKSHDKK